MRPANNDKRRRHRLATSNAMKRTVVHCPECGRGQYNAGIDAGNGSRVRTCRYCGREWGGLTELGAEALAYIKTEPAPLQGITPPRPVFRQISSAAAEEEKP